MGNPMLSYDLILNYALSAPNQNHPTNRCKRKFGHGAEIVPGIYSSTREQVARGTASQINIKARV
jgi:hypothetical protein